MEAKAMVALLAAVVCGPCDGDGCGACNDTGRRWPALRERCPGVVVAVDQFGLELATEIEHWNDVCCDGSKWRDVEPRVAAWEMYKQGNLHRGLLGTTDQVWHHDKYVSREFLVLAAAMAEAGIEVTGDYRDARRAAPPPGTDSPEAEIRKLRG